jgi:DNA-binding response OmpR family regulator
MARSILVADDEAKLVALVAGYLEASGFSVTGCGNGAEALEAFRAGKHDCLILDINMPGLDGLAVAREVRKTSDVPIVFLTARTDEIDRIVGFEIGADDYVPKPFSPRELVARVKAILRRGGGRRRDDAKIIRGSISIDPARREVRIRNAPVELTSVQFDILLFMMRDPGRVWTRLDILGSSSGSTFDGYERTIDAHIKNIRKAIDDDSDNPRFIETVRGIGYRFREQTDEA